MNISFLLLSSFRNYRHLELALSPGVSLFFGHNAAGKTNLLEACYYLSSLSSPRAERDSDLALWGAETFSVGCRVDHQSGSQSIKVQVAVVPTLKRKVTIENVPVKKIELTRALPSVYFSPDDLYMVKRGSSLRRKFFDSLLSRLDQEYARQLTRYQDALTRRNVALKKTRGNPSWQKTLESLGDLLIHSGSVILEKRLRCMTELKREVSETYRFISGEECTVAYASSIGELGEEGGGSEGISRTFQCTLAALRSQEIERGITLVGPHRDDIVLSLNDRPVRYFGSQGEQRSAALALKIAEARILEEVFDKKPVLLFDDVFSELDEERRRKVLSLCDFGHQILITSTDPIQGIWPDVAAFRVGEGDVVRAEGGRTQ